MPNHSQGCPIASLKPVGLPPTGFAQLRDELQQAHRGIERAVPCRRDAVDAHRHAARRGNFRADLGGGQHAAVTGFGALRQLDLDHLHLRIAGVVAEPLEVEATMLIAATEVPRADLPRQVATEFAVVGRNRALARIVIEAAKLRALVQCADRVGRQRAETHRRDVEHAGGIRLRAPARIPADGHTEVVGSGCVGASEWLIHS